MQSVQMNPARKGTRSCTECRRRKVRCISSVVNPDLCRRCEERGTRCVAQAYSSRPAQIHRLSSRQRITQLEGEVATLKKVVHCIQSKLGANIPEELESRSSAPAPALEDESDDESSDSDALAAEQPLHLRSLFQNEWLSVDTGQRDERSPTHKVKGPSRLLDLARQALQKLIPSKEEVAEVIGASSKWILMLHAFLPRAMTFHNQQDLIDSYDDMCKPDVDTMFMASWLLDVSVAAQQPSPPPGSQEGELQRIERISKFGHAVSDTVENMLMRHDELLSSVKGLAMAVHYTRLQISQGNIQKAWVRMRHIIAIAELAGLPKASQSLGANLAAKVDTEEVQVQKAEIWDLICSADKLLGMVTNLPTYTRRFQQTNIHDLTVNGVVQPKVYLRRLADISSKVQELDELRALRGPNHDLRDSAMGLEHELKALGSHPPQSWWEEEVVTVKLDYILRMLHCYIMMRIHLPFAVQRHPHTENAYNRMACMNACETLAGRYRSLRPLLPSGVFISAILDLQAFTAVVVLLLNFYGTYPSIQAPTHADRVRIDGWVIQVIQILDQKGNEAMGSNFARKGSIATQALRSFLQENTDPSKLLPAQLRLRVPLLGTIQILRNVPPPHRPNYTPTEPSGNPSNVFQWDNREEVGRPQIQSRHTAPNDASGNTVETHPATPWDPLPWFIEDAHDSFFHDAFMTESIDPLDMWHTDTDNFTMVDRYV